MKDDALKGAHPFIASPIPVFGIEATVILLKPKLVTFLSNCLSIEYKLAAASSKLPLLLRLSSPKSTFLNPRPISPSSKDDALIRRRRL